MKRPAATVAAFALGGLLLTLSSASAVTPWLYQLKNPNAHAVLESGFQTAVLDYSRDGTDGGRLPVTQVQALRRDGVVALAYIAVAEAADYRFYWSPGWVAQKGSNDFSSSAPGWLGHTFSEFPDVYKVRYWDVAWRDNALKPYLDRVIRQGFSGVYLDLGAFEYWANSSSYGPNGETFRAGDPKGDVADASRRMIHLVEWIARYGKARSGRDFLVFQQNEVALSRFDRGGNYLRSLTGFGVDDMFFNETGRQPLSETNYRLRYLRPLRAQGKRVLCVDYLDNGQRTNSRNMARINEFVDRCTAEQFDYYAARAGRSLAFINRIPGIQP